MTVLLKPDIQSVAITPNPVSANTSFLMSVKVTEIEIILEPIIIYCGTFYCGESGEI